MLPKGNLRLRVHSKLDAATERLRAECKREQHESSELLAEVAFHLYSPDLTYPRGQHIVGEPFPMHWLYSGGELLSCRYFCVFGGFFKTALRSVLEQSPRIKFFCSTH